MKLKNSKKWELDWRILASIGKSLIRAFIAAGGVTVVITAVQAVLGEFIPATYLAVITPFISPIIKLIQKWATDYSK